MKMEQKQKVSLPVGEKYLSIKIKLGALGEKDLGAFLNKNKKDAKHPDFVGKDVAVWVNTVREKKENNNPL